MKVHLKFMSFALLGYPQAPKDLSAVGFSSPFLVPTRGQWVSSYFELVSEGVVSPANVPEGRISIST